MVFIIQRMKCTTSSSCRCETRKLTLCVFQHVLFAAGYLDNHSWQNNAYWDAVDQCDGNSKQRENASDKVGHKISHDLNREISHEISHGINHVDGHFGLSKKGNMDQNSSRINMVSMGLCLWFLLSSIKWLLLKDGFYVLPDSLCNAVYAWAENVHGGQYWIKQDKYQWQKR